MPKRSRYPAPSAITHISIRGAAVATNIIFIGFLAHLTSIYNRTYPAAYVAAIWALLGDALEIGGPTQQRSLCSTTIEWGTADTRLYRSSASGTWSVSQLVRWDLFI